MAGGHISSRQRSYYGQLYREHGPTVDAVASSYPTLPQTSEWRHPEVPPEQVEGPSRRSLRERPSTPQGSGTPQAQGARYGHKRC
jgi:hypothetical protein